MGAAPTRKEGKVMKLTIDGREVEFLSIALTDAEGKTSSHAISASALAGELGTSMREVSLTTARAQVREVRKTANADALEGYGDFLKAAEVASVLGVSSRMVTRLSERDEIPAIRIGRAWRFPRERLREYLER